MRRPERSCNTLVDMKTQERSYKLHIQALHKAKAIVNTSAPEPNPHAEISRKLATKERKHAARLSEKLSATIPQRFDVDLYFGKKSKLQEADDAKAFHFDKPPSPERSIREITTKPNWVQEIRNEYRGFSSSSPRRVTLPETNINADIDEMFPDPSSDDEFDLDTIPPEIQQKVKERGIWPESDSDQDEFSKSILGKRVQARIDRIKTEKRKSIERKVTDEAADRRRTDQHFKKFNSRYHRDDLPRRTLQMHQGMTVVDSPPRASAVLVSRQLVIGESTAVSCDDQTDEVESFKTEIKSVLNKIIGDGSYEQLPSIRGTVAIPEVGEEEEANEAFTLPLPSISRLESSRRRLDQPEMKLFHIPFFDSSHLESISDAQNDTSTLLDVTESAPDEQKLDGGDLVQNLAGVVVNGGNSVAEAHDGDGENTQSLAVVNDSEGVNGSGEQSVTEIDILHNFADALVNGCCPTERATPIKVELDSESAVNTSNQNSVVSEEMSESQDRSPHRKRRKKPKTKRGYFLDKYVYNPNIEMKHLEKYREDKQEIEVPTYTEDTVSFENSVSHRYEKDCFFLQEEDFTQMGNKSRKNNPSQRRTSRKSAHVSPTKKVKVHSSSVQTEPIDDSPSKRSRHRSHRRRRRDEDDPSETMDTHAHTRNIVEEAPKLDIIQPFGVQLIEAIEICEVKEQGNVDGNDTVDSEKCDTETPKPICDREILNTEVESEQTKVKQISDEAKEIEDEPNENDQGIINTETENGEQVEPVADSVAVEDESCNKETEEVSEEREGECNECIKTNETDKQEREPDKAENEKQENGENESSDTNEAGSDHSHITNETDKQAVNESSKEETATDESDKKSDTGEEKERKVTDRELEVDENRENKSGERSESDNDKNSGSKDEPDKESEEKNETGTNKVNSSINESGSEKEGNENTIDNESVSHKEHPVCDEVEPHEEESLSDKDKNESTSNDHLSDRESDAEGRCEINQPEKGNETDRMSDESESHKENSADKSCDEVSRHEESLSDKDNDTESHKENQTDRVNSAINESGSEEEKEEGNESESHKENSTDKACDEEEKVNETESHKENQTEKVETREEENHSDKDENESASDDCLSTEESECDLVTTNSLVISRDPEHVFESSREETLRLDVPEPDHHFISEPADESANEEDLNSYVNEPSRIQLVICESSTVDQNIVETRERDQIEIEVSHFFSAPRESTPTTPSQFTYVTCSPRSSKIPVKKRKKKPEIPMIPISEDEILPLDEELYETTTAVRDEFEEEEEQEKFETPQRKHRRSRHSHSPTKIRMSMQDLKNRFLQSDLIDDDDDYQGLKPQRTSRMGRVAEKTLMVGGSPDIIGVNDALRKTVDGITARTSPQVVTARVSHQTKLGGVRWL